MLCDDISYELEQYSTRLKSYGHSVAAFYNSVEALVYLEQARDKKEGLPDVILTDRHMPLGGLFGPDFAIETRKRGFSMPIIIYTKDNDYFCGGMVKISDKEEILFRSKYMIEDTYAAINRLLHSLVIVNCNLHLKYLEPIIFAGISARGNTTRDVMEDIDFFHMDRFRYRGVYSIVSLEQSISFAPDKYLSYQDMAVIFPVENSSIIADSKSIYFLFFSFNRISEFKRFSCGDIEFYFFNDAFLNSKREFFELFVAVVSKRISYHFIRNSFSIFLAETRPDLREAFISLWKLGSEYWTSSNSSENVSLSKKKPTVLESFLTILKNPFSFEYSFKDLKGITCSLKSNEESVIYLPPNLIINIPFFNDDVKIEIREFAKENTAPAQVRHTSGGMKTIAEALRTIDLSIHAPIGNRKQTPHSASPISSMFIDLTLLIALALGMFAGSYFYVIPFSLGKSWKQAYELFKINFSQDLWLRIRKKAVFNKSRDKNSFKKERYYLIGAIIISLEAYWEYKMGFCPLNDVLFMWFMLGMIGGLDVWNKEMRKALSALEQEPQDDSDIKNSSSPISIKEKIARLNELLAGRELRKIVAEILKTGGVKLRRSGERRKPKGAEIFLALYSGRKVTEIKQSFGVSSKWVYFNFSRWANEIRDYLSAENQGAKEESQYLDPIRFKGIILQIGFCNNSYLIPQGWLKAIYGILSRVEKYLKISVFKNLELNIYEENYFRVNSFKDSAIYIGVPSQTINNQDIERIAAAFIQIFINRKLLLCNWQELIKKAGFELLNDKGNIVYSISRLIIIKELHSWNWAVRLGPRNKLWNICPSEDVPETIESKISVIKHPWLEQELNFFKPVNIELKRSWEEAISGPREYLTQAFLFLSGLSANSKLISEINFINFELVKELVGFKDIISSPCFQSQREPKQWFFVYSIWGKIDLKRELGSFLKIIKTLFRPTGKIINVRCHIDKKSLSEDNLARFLQRAAYISREEITVVLAGLWYHLCIYNACVNSIEWACKNKISIYIILDEAHLKSSSTWPIDKIREKYIYEECEYICELYQMNYQMFFDNVTKKASDKIHSKEPQVIIDVFSNLTKNKEQFLLRHSEITSLWQKNKIFRSASPIISFSSTSLIALALGMLMGYYQDEIPFILNRIRKELSELKRTTHQGLETKIKKYLTNSDKDKDESDNNYFSSPVIIRTLLFSESPANIRPYTGDSNKTAAGSVFLLSSPVIILVVDNDSFMTETFTDELQDLDYTVITADNGKKALDISISRNDINLIITDNNMPVMTGKEFVKELRRVNKEIPVVMMTAHLTDQFKNTMRELGVKSFLEKPFKVDEAGEFVRSLLINFQKRKNGSSSQNIFSSPIFGKSVDREKVIEFRKEEGYPTDDCYEIYFKGQHRGWIRFVEIETGLCVRVIAIPTNLAGWKDVYQFSLLEVLQRTVNGNFNEVIFESVSNDIYMREVIRRFDVIAVKYGAVYFDKKIKQPATAWIELDPAKSNIESGRLFIDPRLGY
ncbi:MAG: response regulator, partial [Candidatus Omnitrophota bacterium]